MLSVGEWGEKRTRFRRETPGFVFGRCVNPRQDQMSQTPPQLLALDRARFYSYLGIHFCKTKADRVFLSAELAGCWNK